MTMTPNTDSVAVLRECPFCGYEMSAEEDAAYQKAGFMGAQTPVWAVTCGSTQCNAEVATASRETAVAAWNRRAALSAQRERTVAESAQAIHAAVASGQQPKASDMHKVFGDPRVSVTVSPLHPAPPGSDAVTEEMWSVLEGVRSLTNKAAEHWDADEDMKVGKILMALAGHLDKYDARADALTAALAARTEGGRNG